jgi:hypothetical protein
MPHAEPISLELCSKNNPRNIKHMPVEDPGFLTGLVPALQRGGYFFRMPFYPVLFSGGF